MSFLPASHPTSGKSQVHYLSLPVSSWLWDTLREDPCRGRYGLLHIARVDTVFLGHWTHFQKYLGPLSQQVWCLISLQMVTSLFVWHFTGSILWRLFFSLKRRLYTQPKILMILIKSLDICFVPFSWDSAILSVAGAVGVALPSLWGLCLWFIVPTCLWVSIWLLWPVLSVCCRFERLSDCIPTPPRHKFTWPSAADVYSRRKAKSTDSDQTRRGNWKWSRRKHCLPLIVLLFFQVKQHTGILGRFFFFSFLDVCDCPNYFRSTVWYFGQVHLRGMSLIIKLLKTTVYHH